MKDPLWSSGEVRVATGGQSLRPWFADAIQVDSRSVLPGDLFVALEGGKSDGHRYVEAALEKGAASVLVHKEIPGLDAGRERLTVVKDTRKALEDLARHARDRAPAIRIGVTGSVGKTTVVQGLSQSLCRDGLHASFKSYNNHIGVPLSLARMPRAACCAVLEMGMSGPGEIAALSTMVKPDISVITTVGLAHREGFDSTEGIADAKAEIFQGQRAGDTALIGIDHDHASRLLQAAESHGLKVYTVSAHRDADIRLAGIRRDSGDMRIVADVMGEMITTPLAQAGEAWAFNCLVMLGVAKLSGQDAALTASRLSTVEAEPGRGRTHMLSIAGQSVLLIDDSYNANPSSMKAALQRLHYVDCPSRKLALLGDMHELGSQAEQAHMALVPALRSAGLDHVYAAGDLMAQAARAAGLAVSRLSPDDAPYSLETDLGSDDVLLIKGSNAVGLQSISDYLIANYGRTRLPMNPMLHATRVDLHRAAEKDGIYAI